MYKVADHMLKERIVLETSNKRKTALVKKLALQGDTLSDWLEEQLTLALPNDPLANEELKLLHLRPKCRSNDKQVLSALKKQDWSFTDDDTRYLTHDLHPYPAKFIPQIPSHLIAALSDPGDVIFDPFGGSGTTAVEAVRMGRRAVSADANPLSCLIGRVKTGFMTPSVRASIDQLHATIASHLLSAEFNTSCWTDNSIAKYSTFIPDIPNIEKWFDRRVSAELALIRFLIEKITDGLSSDAAQLALSRIILRVSFQDSETRYVARPKEIDSGLALKAFLDSLSVITKRLESGAQHLQKADAQFLFADTRTDYSSDVGRCSVVLLITSPPYPNATDYHLYHRFRLFWLGYDPRKLGRIEIGSHLRHQRNGSGFEEYKTDMQAALGQSFLVMKPGGHAVFIVGDAVFKGETFSTADAIVEAATIAGFESIGRIERPIHRTKRSFSSAARRARSEYLVVFRKPESSTKVILFPPKYKMWDYEVDLRKMEIGALCGANKRNCSAPLEIEVDNQQLDALRKLTFSVEYQVDGDSLRQPTWQRVLENGDANLGTRKDSKYATHGIHPFKGKFYPQLAKSLMNISGVPEGSRVLDPFCGSGTVLLEGMLNGMEAFGCDLNPLATKIARAKTGILELDRAVTEHAIRSLMERLTLAPERFSKNREQFNGKLDELERWFPSPVLNKLDWILLQIRLFGNPVLVEYFEVLVSSVIREISHQDPADLRIRRRKEPLRDAPVLELVVARLEDQLQRLIKYWSVAGRQPTRRIAAKVLEGDNRCLKTYTEAGLSPQSVDCVVTSPPYATALPYIDTDRLSLLSIMGIESSIRSTLESDLTGSREIRKSERNEFESLLLSKDALDELPKSIVVFLRQLYKANLQEGVGFRRANMAALLWRYFIDMRENLKQVYCLLKDDGVAYYVVGDSRTKAGEEWTAIETCKSVQLIADFVGFDAKRLLDISVTTENYRHIKNAITENAVLQFHRRYD